MTEPRIVPPAPGMPAETLRRYLSDAAQRDLDALRAAVGERLAALESALTSPGSGGSLESLIFDLARAVSAESESATMRTALAAQLQAEERIAAAVRDAGRAAEDAQNTITALRRELEQARAAVAAENDRAGSLKRELDAAQASLAAERKDATAVRADLEQARASIASQTDAAEALRRDLDAAHQSLEAEQRASASARAELEAARGAVAQEQASSAATADESRRALEAARAASENLRRELDESRATLDAERTRSADLEGELSRAREELTGDREAGASAQRQRDELQAALAMQRDEAAQLRATIEEARAGAAAERERITQLETDLAASTAAVGAERAAREARERDLQEERTALQTERDAVAALYEEIQAAQRSLEAERGRVTALESELATERDARAAAVESLAALERETASSRDVGPAPGSHAALDAFEQQLADLQKSLDAANARAEEAARERDTLAAGLNASRETGGTAAAQHEEQLAAAHARIRELEVKLFGRAREPQEADIELTPLLQTEAPTGEQPVRRATRYSFKEHPVARIGTEPAELVDLSTSGAQIISSRPLDEGVTVEVELISDETPVTCQAKIMWTRVERASKKQPVQYRAGILFTNADETAIEAFIIRYATPVKKSK